MRTLVKKGVATFLLRPSQAMGDELLTPDHCGGCVEHSCALARVGSYPSKRKIVDSYMCKDQQAFPTRTTKYLSLDSTLCVFDLVNIIEGLPLAVTELGA